MLRSQISRSLSVFSVLLLGGMLSASQAHADVLISLFDDGNGNLAGTMTGSYDFAAAIPSSGSSNGDFFLSGGAPGSLLWGATTSVTNWQQVDFAPTLSAGPIRSTSGTLSSFPSALTINDWGVSIFGSQASISDYSGVRGSGSTAINESFVYSNISFSEFNLGVWEYGDFGGAVDDGVRLQIVPEPASLSLLALGGLALIRRSRLA